MLSESGNLMGGVASWLFMQCAAGTVFAGDGRLRRGCLGTRKLHVRHLH